MLAARYVPVGRVAVNLAAGAAGYPLRRFTGFAALAALTWASWSVLLGVAAGTLLQERPLLAIALGVGLGMLLGLGIDAVATRRRARREDVVPSGCQDGAPEQEEVLDLRDGLSHPARR